MKTKKNKTATRASDAQKAGAALARRGSIPPIKEATNGSARDDDSDQGPSQQEDEVVAVERVALMGLSLLVVGTIGFHSIPGMIVKDADEVTEMSRYRAITSHWINAFYCSAITLTT